MRTRTPGYRINRFFRYANAGIGVVAVVGVCFWAGSLASLHSSLPTELRVGRYQPRLTTEIYSTELHPDGRETHTLLGQVYKENRQLVSLRRIPVYLQQSTVAVEDHRFYQHRGISPRDMLRAAWINLRSRRVAQGASTITQQLVRNMWLSPARTWDRKIKEILLAVAIERRFAKDEILEMYLNEVYYGHGAYGVKTAAWTFFGKRLNELTLGELTLIAGLPKAPAYYSPYNHPKRAKARRREVLAAMRRQGHISAAQFKAADEEQIQSRLRDRQEAGIASYLAPHFTHLVIRLLCDRYGVDTVYAGGLRVYTTLDIRLQRIAEKELKAGVQKRREQGWIKGNLIGQGALACVNVHTGEVLAMVGGVGEYKDIQYNRAHPGPPQYGRQPGSSFKPYVWATALESGYGPNSIFSGGPLSIYVGSGEWWHPKNYSSGQGHNWSLQDALAWSVNLVSVRLVREVGVKKVRHYAATMLDIPAEPRLAPYLSLALGVSELSPLEQASGFACFASGGLQAKRQFIKRIENYGGEVLVRTKPQITRVLRKPVAISMISMLHRVITSGTGKRASAVGYPAGGKTGTTQDGRDAWWVGFTPDLSAAVWMGNDDNSPMRHSSGGGFCAPIWARFMKQAMETLEYNGEFPEGSGVTATRAGQPEEEEEEEEPEGIVLAICTETGRLATRFCPNTAEKYFAPREPIPGRCTKHTGPAGTPATAPHTPSASGEKPTVERPATVRVTICVDSGKLAGPYCPQTVEREFPAGSAPTEVCNLHGPPPAPAEATTAPEERSTTTEPAPGPPPAADQDEPE